MISNFVCTCVSHFNTSGKYQIIFAKFIKKIVGHFDIQIMFMDNAYSTSYEI